MPRSRGVGDLSSLSTSLTPFTMEVKLVSYQVKCHRTCSTPDTKNNFLDAVYMFSIIPKTTAPSHGTPKIIRPPLSTGTHSAASRSRAGQRRKFDIIAQLFVKNEVHEGCELSIILYTHIRPPQATLKRKIRKLFQLVVLRPLVLVEPERLR